MAAGEEEEEESLWTQKHQKFCWWKPRPWFSPYLPVFSTARASLTASFTVVTRSSWGKGSHCWREEREEEKRKEGERERGGSGQKGKEGEKEVGSEK